MIAASCWLLADCCLLLTTGCWLLAVGCWLLAAECLLLAADCWLLADDCWVVDAGSCLPAWDCLRLLAIICDGLRVPATVCDCQRLPATAQDPWRLARFCSPRISKHGPLLGARIGARNRGSIEDDKFSSGVFLCCSSTYDCKFMLLQHIKVRIPGPRNGAIKTYAFLNPTKGLHCCPWS